MLLVLFSHHEYDDYLDVERVYIETDKLSIKYTEPDDIKKILEKIGGVNFYRFFGNPTYNKTPDYEIIITYKDTSRKKIVISGGNVLICTGIYGTDSYNVSIYTYSYYELKNLFNTLPKEKELAQYY